MYVYVCVCVCVRACVRACVYMYKSKCVERNDDLWLSLCSIIAESSKVIGGLWQNYLSHCVQI